MGCFLLNELGEVLLEIKSGLALAPTCGSKSMNRRNRRFCAVLRKALP